MTRRSKQKPPTLPATKTDKFSAWVSAPPKRTNKCATCKGSPGAQTDIARYVELLQAGTPVPHLMQLHDFIRTEHNYTLGYSSLLRHIRLCLGYKPVE